MDYNPKKVLQNLATINCIKLTRQNFNASRPKFRSYKYKELQQSEI